MAGQMAVLGEAVVRLGWEVLLGFASALASYCRRCCPGLALQGGTSIPSLVCSAVSSSKLLCTRVSWISAGPAEGSKDDEGTGPLRSKG